MKEVMTPNKMILAEREERVLIRAWGIVVKYQIIP